MKGENIYSTQINNIIHLLRENSGDYATMNDSKYTRCELIPWVCGSFWIVWWSSGYEFFIVEVLVSVEVVGRRWDGGEALIPMLFSRWRQNKNKTFCWILGVESPKWLISITCMIKYCMLKTNVMASSWVTSSLSINLTWAWTRWIKPSSMQFVVSVANLLWSWA